MNDFPKLCWALVAAFSITACEVERTQEGDMPEVGAEGGQMPKYETTKTQEGELPDVDVEGGQLPEYDVRTSEVEVGTENRQVTVPTVDVDLPDDEEAAPEVQDPNTGISATKRD